MLHHVVRLDAMGIGYLTWYAWNFGLSLSRRLNFKYHALRLARALA